jgi:hypothetical protein
MADSFELNISAPAEKKAPKRSLPHDEPAVETSSIVKRKKSAEPPAAPPASMAPKSESVKKVRSKKHSSATPKKDPSRPDGIISSLFSFNPEIPAATVLEEVKFV